MRKVDIKYNIILTFDKGNDDNLLSRRFDLFIMILILANVVMVIMETMQSVKLQYEAYFHAFEIFSVAVFSIEYALRIWACTILDEYKHPFWGRLKYMLTVEMLIDLMAILPFYLPLFFSFDARILRSLRLFRLLRIFKMARYFVAFQTIKAVFKTKKEELTITFSALMILLVLASSMMYYIEGDIQKETFSSIPATMWWAVATLTTVGYGDVYPITSLGKILGAVIAILGIGMFALPAGILATGFEGEITKRKENNKNKCPNCGHDLDENENSHAH